MWHSLKRGDFMLVYLMEVVIIAIFCLIWASIQALAEKNKAVKIVYTICSSIFWLLALALISIMPAVALDLWQTGDQSAAIGLVFICVLMCFCVFLRGKRSLDWNRERKL